MQNRKTGGHFKFGFVGALGVQLRGGEGGEAPFTPSGRPAVSGAAAATRKLTSIRSYLLRPTNAVKAAFVRGAACVKNALTRTGRCKKIAVSQKVFGTFLVQYVPRYSQFSCGFRRAPRRSRPPSALPAVVFRSRGLRPLDPHRCRRENVGSLTPLNRNLKYSQFPQ